MPVADAVAQAMRRTNELFCNEVIAKGNLNAIADVYSQNARILPPGAPMMQGREAIQAFWKAAAEMLQPQSATLTTLEAEMCGDTVVEIGRANIRQANGGEIVGKYIVHWKQQDGRWLWDKDIWNVD